MRTADARIPAKLWDYLLRFVDVFVLFCLAGSPSRNNVISAWFARGVHSVIECVVVGVTNVIV